MSAIRIYKSNEPEAIRLNLFADFCNALYKAHKTNEEIKVEEIYFDFGQNWMYTALVTYDYDGKSSWQTVGPRDYEIIINCTNEADLFRYADYYVTARIDCDAVCIDLSKIA